MEGNVRRRRRNPAAGVPAQAPVRNVQPIAAAELMLPVIRPRCG